MKTRNCLRYSAWPLCIASIAGFALIFILGLTLLSALQYDLESFAPLQPANEAIWGQIPGQLQYNFTKEITLFNLTGFGPTNTKQLEFESVGPFVYTVERNLTDTTFDNLTKTVNYGEFFNYTEQTSGRFPFKTDKTDGTEARFEPRVDSSDILTTLNMDGLSLWYQMNRMPEFWRAWQSMGMVQESMMGTDMYITYLAYQAYNYYFNNRTDVADYVLVGPSPNDKATIYDDKTYGMNTNLKMRLWVKACIDGEESLLATTIQNELSSLYAGFNISTVIGPASMLQQIINNVNGRVYNNPQYGFCPADRYLNDTTDTIEPPCNPFNSQQLVQYQWGSANFLNDTSLLLPGVIEQNTIAASEFTGQLFAAKPEYGYYVWNTRSVGVNFEQEKLNLTQSQLLFEAPKVGNNRSNQTLLDPDNVHSYFTLYSSGDYGAIQDRFQISEQQVEPLFQYLNSSSTNFLSFGKTYNVASQGDLFQTALNQSLAQIEQVLPLELISRQMAQATNSGNKCVTYCEQACREGSQSACALSAQQICNAYNMSDPTQIKLFINATWYGGEYLTNLTKATGWNQQEVDNFFSNPSSISNNFGEQMALYLKVNSQTYGCKNESNCTGDELALLQWGKSGVTQKLPYTNDDYFPSSFSIGGQWGSFVTEGSPIPAEYFYYSNNYGGQVQELDKATVKTMNMSNVIDFGLNSFYNSARFAYSIIYQDQDIQKSFVAAYPSIVNPQAVYFAMTDLLQDFLLGGTTLNMTVTDYILGFHSKPVKQIYKDASFTSGSYFPVTDAVTPIMNTQLGEMSRQNVTVRTGTGESAGLGTVSKLNGLDTMNRRIDFWDGYKNSTYYDYPSSDTSSISSSEPKNQFSLTTSDGINFIPRYELESREQEQAQQVQYADLRNLHIFNYTFSNNSFVNQLEYERYDFDQNEAFLGTQGIKIGLAYNNDYSLFGANCFNCSSVANIDNVFIDGVRLSTYAKLSSPGEWYLEIEPLTGTLVNMKRQGTILMTLDCYESNNCDDILPFPSLKGYTRWSFPVFNFTETIEVNQQILAENLSFIQEKHSLIKSISIWLTVVAFTCFVLGFCFCSVYLMNEPLDLGQPNERLKHFEEEQEKFKNIEHEKLESDFIENKQVEVRRFVVME